MKHVINLAAWLLTGCVYLLTSMVAWAIPPESFTSDPVPVEGAPMFPCTQFGMNFWVLADWTYTEYGKMHFDQYGVPVRINGFGVVTAQRAYNSADDSFEITGEGAAGRGEHRHFVVKFDGFPTAVFYKEAGISTRIIVPGHGPMLVDIGQIRLESEDGFDWQVTNFTPNLGTSESEMFALCSYLNHE